MSDQVEKDANGIQQSLMNYLCKNHRINARQGKPIVFDIEQIRFELYHANIEKDHFRDILVRISEGEEIQIDQNDIQLTNRGLENCRNYAKDFIRDF